MTTNTLYPTKTRFFMSEVAGRRRYHCNPSRARAAARCGVLWVAMQRGWSCHPEHVATFLALVERRQV